MNLRYLLPKTVRSYLISKHLKFDRKLDHEIEIKIASNVSEFEQAFKLLHDCYVGLGIMDPENCGMRCNLYSAVPFTNVVIAKKGDNVIATLSLIQDSEFGLPCDAQYKKENDNLRAKGKRLVEVSAMAVHKSYRKTQGGSFINLFMMNYLHKFSVDFMGADYLIATVHPHAQPFYSTLFNFKRNGRVTTYESVKGAAAVHMSLNLKTLREYMLRKYGHRKENSNLFDFFFKDNVENFKFPIKSKGVLLYPTMDDSTLKYFFEAKTELFYSLRPKDLMRIKASYDWTDSNPCFDSLNDLGQAALGPRVHFRLPTKIESMLTINLSLMKCEIKNLSLSGCLISSLQPICNEVDQKVEMKFYLNSARHEVTGRIVRINCGSDHSGEYRYGIMFNSGFSQLKNSMEDMCGSFKTVTGGWLRSKKLIV